MFLFLFNTYNIFLMVYTKNTGEIATVTYFENFKYRGYLILVLEKTIKLNIK